MPEHHPDRERYPDWTLSLRNHLFHQVCTVCQRMKATTENLADIRALIDALEYEYLMKRRVLDCGIQSIPSIRRNSTD